MTTTSGRGTNCGLMSDVSAMITATTLIEKPRRSPDLKMSRASNIFWVVIPHAVDV